MVHIASIFRVTILWVFPARSKDKPHDRWQREPLAAAPPQSCLSVTMELLWPINNNSMVKVKLDCGGAAVRLIFAQTNTPVPSNRFMWRRIPEGYNPATSKLKQCTFSLKLYSWKSTFKLSMPLCHTCSTPPTTNSTCGGGQILCTPSAVSDTSCNKITTMGGTCSTIGRDEEPTN
jgi:hypothetical protein